MQETTEEEVKEISQETIKKMLREFYASVSEIGESSDLITDTNFVKLVTSIASSVMSTMLFYLYRIILSQGDKLNIEEIINACNEAVKISCRNEIKKLKDHH